MEQDKKEAKFFSLKTVNGRIAIVNINYISFVIIKRGDEDNPIDDYIQLYLDNALGENRNYSIDLSEKDKLESYLGCKLTENDDTVLMEQFDNPKNLWNFTKNLSRTPTVTNVRSVTKEELDDIVKVELDACKVPQAQCEYCSEWVDAEELDINEYALCIDCAEETCSFCSEGRCTNRCKT